MMMMYVTGTGTATAVSGPQTMTAKDVKGGKNMIEITDIKRVSEDELQMTIRALPAAEQETARKAAVAMGRLKDEET